MSTDAPIAVVGMACRLPGADNLQQYWQLILEGRCAVGELPPDRLCRDLYYHPEKGQRAKSYSTIGGVVNPRAVDSSAWRLTQQTRDAADVVHLELCAVTEDALRHGGMDPHDLVGRRAGVYVGHTRGGSRSNRMSYATLVGHTAEYLREVPGFDELVNGQTSDVVREAIDAVRNECPKCDEPGGPCCAAYEGARMISEAFGLDGPFFSVDAACASSLMAMTMGMQALQLGAIDMAVVGGASRCEYDTMVLFSKAQSISASGSRPFDADADGLVAAEGYVIFVLKTLQRALADEDPIWAVIRGAGVSSDGRGKSLWAPRKEGQIAAIHRAYSSPEEMSKLQYIEAHATSTHVGDATEMSALTEAMREHLPPGAKIPIGTVKANVGHTLEVAGVAGLLKVILAMQHRTIPPVTGVSRLNPKIDWDQAPFSLPESAQPWLAPKDGGPRRAAVNAFGIGGLNTHVVVDEFLLDHLPPTVAGLTPFATRPIPQPDFEPIAIIGAGAIFPCASSLEAFWDLLKSGRSAISEVPPDRWRMELGYEVGARGPWRSPSRMGGFIRDFEYDWKKHRVPPKQVAKADPLQFMLLDAVEQALEHSGLKAKQFDRSRVGVIVGTSFGGDFSKQLQAGIHLPEFHQTLRRILRKRGVAGETIESICELYGDILLSHLPGLEDETGSFTPSTLASRITKTFDLSGGAASVDSGDASALGALDICVQMIRSGRNDMMICAAGQRAMGLASYERMSMLGWLACDDARAPYDAHAAGLVPGEGVGVVILKRLSAAERDGNKVYAVIRGIGSSKQDSLQAAVREAVRRCHQPGNIGTTEVATVVSAACGTPSIDQSEAEGLDLAFAKSTRAVALSTVAGQIGHCGGSSGMASLLKAVLLLEHKEIPGGRAAAQMAPWISRCRSLRLVERGEAISDRGRALAGISSHDMHHLAYHVALECPDAVTMEIPLPQPNLQWAKPAVGKSPCRIVRVGAEDFPAVYRRATELLRDPSTWFQNTCDKPFPAQTRARLAIVAGSPDELARKAKLAIEQHNNQDARVALMDRGVFYGVVPRRRPLVAFLFPGQASQYSGMLKSLIAGFEPAADAVRSIDSVLARLGIPCFEEIVWKDGDRLGTDAWHTQFAVLLGDTVMFAALRALGIRPDRISSHSFGEFPALWAAGAWSFADAARATDARCRAIQESVPSGGMMVSTTASLAIVKELCDADGGDVSVTNHNSPTQVVVGGSQSAVMRLTGRLEADGHKTLALPVPCPFHTPLLEPAKVLFSDALRQIPLRPPATPVLSSVTNSYVAEPDEIRRNLARQLTDPVRYVELMQRLADDGLSIFVEVGPKRVLTRLNREILPQAISIPTDDRNRDGFQSLLHVRACLEVQGALPNDRDDSLDFDDDASETIFGSGDAAAASAQSNSSRAYLAGFQHASEHLGQVRAALRRNADHAGYNGRFPTTLAKVASAAERVFSSDELDELRGVADGARVSLPSVIAHNLLAFRRGKPAASGSTAEAGVLTAPRKELLDLARGNESSNRPQSTDHRQSVVSPAVYLKAMNGMNSGLPAASQATVCRRFVLRLVPMPHSSDEQSEPLSGAAIVHGDNKIARAISACLQRAGMRAIPIAGHEAGQCVAALDRAWQETQARFLFLTTPYDTATSSNGPDRREHGVTAPFLLCQRWHELLKSANLFDQGRLVALMNLGGDFGLSHDVPAVVGGALNGLMKALYVEEAQPGQALGFRSLSVDFDEGMPVEQIAETACREIAIRTSEVEVGYLGGRRHVVRALPRTTAGTSDLARIKGGVCIVTGGGRGVTALVARELAREFNWHLHLIGTSPAPRVREQWRALTTEETKALRTSVMRQALADGAKPLDAWNRIEKAIEIDANLQAFAEAGIRAQYHACDISDRDDLSAVLNTIRKQGRPIAGVIHGAGFEKSCRFKSKKQELVGRTLRAKVHGAAWLMKLTRDDPLRFFVGFGSTSGCLGSHGQADYCAANDMLAKLIDRFRSERRDCHSAIFHWHAWDEVGMAVRPEVAGVLKSFGLNFMPTREGIGFLADELRAGLPESEVLITEPSHYRRLRPQSDGDGPVSRGTILKASQSTDVSNLPMIDEIEEHEPNQQITAITRLDPTREPFLIQHTLRGKPVLPLVVALEAFAEAANVFSGQRVVEFRNIEVINPLRFFHAGAQSARTRITLSDEVFKCELLCDFVNQRGVTMKKDRPHLNAELITGESSLPAQAIPNEPPRWHDMEYPDDKHVIYHGPVLRCFQGAFGEKPAAIARIVAPQSLAELGGQRRGDGWAFSPAVLDACFYAAGGHLWYFFDGAVGIPQSVDRLVLGRLPRPLEECRLIMKFHGESEDRGKFDLRLIGVNGEVVFLIDGYHNVIIPGTRG